MKVSFKPIIFHRRQRKDKTFSVFIRIGYNSKYANIDTNISAYKSDLARNGEIKNAKILDKCNLIIAEYRSKLDGVDISEYDVQMVKSFLIDNKDYELDFIELFDDFLEKRNDSPSLRNYKATYNQFVGYFGKKCKVNDLTPNALSKFEKHLSNRVGSRGVNLYLTVVRTVYNYIIDEYEYQGYTFRYPFRKYKIPKARPPKTVALTKVQLRAIIEAELEGIRANRARDIFVISLFALGTNAKDLYMLEEIRDRIEYNRSKTKGKRDDEAFISIKVEPELMPYLEKYKGKAKALSFADMYANPQRLNAGISHGLRDMVSQINNVKGKDFLPHIVYYDARRSMASIMRNRLGISKDDVAMCLNHVDTDMRVTDMYIEKDFSILDKCNRKFLDYLFDKD